MTTAEKPLFTASEQLLKLASIILSLLKEKHKFTDIISEKVVTIHAATAHDAERLTG